MSSAAGMPEADRVTSLKCHRCGLPESVGRHRDAGSAARHSGREHMHGIRGVRERQHIRGGQVARQHDADGMRAHSSICARQLCRSASA